MQKPLALLASFWGNGLDLHWHQGSLGGCPLHAQLSRHLLDLAQEGVGKALQALACRSRSLTLFSWLRSDGINQSAFASKVLQRVLEPSRPCVLWPSFELPVRVCRNKQNQRAPWGYKQLLPGTHLLQGGSLCSQGIGVLGGNSQLRLLVIYEYTLGIKIPLQISCSARTMFYAYHT